MIISLLDWSLEHPWATFMWFIVALFIIEDIADAIIGIIKAVCGRHDETKE